MEKEKKSDSAPGSVVMGTIVAFALKTVPPGWLLCDGSPIPAKYGPLITALSSKYTPNLGGLTLIGTGGSNPTYNLGGKGGSEKHQLKVDEMPKHHHEIPVTFGLGGAGWAESPDYYYTNSKGPVNSYKENYRSNPHYKKLSSSSSGSSEAFSIMQPYYVVQYIIFAGT